MISVGCTSDYGRSVEIRLPILQELLLRRPVLLGDNPFVPICLSPQVDLIANGESLIAELDAPSPHKVRPIAVLNDGTPEGSRFGPAIEVKPTAEEINKGLPFHTEYVRSAFIQQSDVAAFIVAETVRRQFDIVVFIVIDGLSYDDVLGWSWPALPCFVNGPSITSVGYPNSVGQPSLARRLRSVGLTQARGFSYWERDNKLTDRLFTGVPLSRISNFPMLLTELRTLDLHGMYLQIVREGLDRLAHHRREVSLAERQSTVDEIARNCEDLANLLVAQRLYGCIYLTADHGLLWKAEHNFSMLETNDHAHPRYALISPNRPELAMPIIVNGQPFFAYYYPYIGARIRDNDAGIHGGCSYQESFVPLVRIEVQP